MGKNVGFVQRDIAKILAPEIDLGLSFSSVIVKIEAATSKLYPYNRYFTKITRN